jgi:PHD/YefM family antitoxin component YafN of YafNO toxin-antitoxin module
MVQRIPITEARRNLGALARRIRTEKGYAILEKDGIPVLGIMDADELEDYLERRDPKAQEAIAESNEDIRAGRVRPAAEFLSELGATAKAPKAKGRRK